jgi:hypothetical protein
MLDENAPQQIANTESTGSEPVQAVQAVQADSAPAIDSQVVTPDSTPEENAQEENEQNVEPEITEESGAEPAGEQKVNLSEVLKLRKRAQEAERRAAFLEGRLQGQQPQTPSTPEAKEAQPKFTPLEDYEGSYEDWLTAKTKHEIKWEQIQEQKKAQAGTVEKNYIERCNKAASEIPDLQETINAAQLPVFDNVFVNAVKKSDLGPQIVYYLSKNPAEAAKLAQIDPELAIMELGSIREKAKTMFQQKPKKMTNAPPPLNPGNGAGATVITDLADKKMSDYAKSRDSETFIKVGGRIIRRG